MMTETNVKGLALLKEAIPGISRVAVIFDPATPSHVSGLKAIMAAGPPLGLRIKSCRAYLRQSTTAPLRPSLVSARRRS